MDIFIILKISNFLFTVFLTGFSLIKLKGTKIKILFVLAVVFFFLSTLTFNGHGLITEWLKHGVFFIGQFLLYLFLNSLVNRHLKERENIPGEPKKPAIEASSLAVMPLFLSDIGDWFKYSSDQGFHHVLSLPLLILTIGLIRARYVFLESKQFKSVINVFMLAVVFLAMIHIVEFFIENQNILPFLKGDIVEIIEFILFYLGFSLLGIGLIKLK